MDDGWEQGKYVSEIARQNISNARKLKIENGYVMSDETKLKLSIINKGKKYNEAARLKNAEGRRGRKHSAESVRKRIETRTRNKELRKNKI